MVRRCMQMIQSLHNHLILLSHILNLFLKEFDDLPLPVDHLTVEVNHYPTQTHKPMEITRDHFKGLVDYDFHFLALVSV